MISLTNNYPGNIKKRVCLCLCSITVFTFFTVTCSANELSDADINELFSGAVLVRSVENANGIPGVLAAFAIPTPRETIWAVLLDYANFKKIFNNIIDLKVIQQDSQGALVEYWVDAVLKNLNYTLYRKYDIPNHKLTWRRKSGDLEIIEGSWSIIESSKSDTKIVVYRSFVKVGRIIPTRLVRWGAMRKAESMCKKLKKHILAST